MRPHDFNDLMDSDRLSHTGDRLYQLARAKYVRAADGFFDVATRPGVIDEASATTVNDVIHQLSAHAPSLNAQVDQYLHRHGFTGYSYLVSGSNADVIKARHANGHAYAIRIEHSSGADTRIISPFVVQAYQEYRDDDYALQAMPMVQILDQRDSEVPYEQQRTPLGKADARVVETTLRHMAMYAFNHCTSWAMKDMAVLPDGTPVQVDPGQISYLDPDMGKKPDIIANGLNNLHHYALALGDALPEQFQWFTAGGVWKQDLFFANPFTITPQYRGFRPSSF